MLVINAVTIIIIITWHNPFHKVPREQLPEQWVSLHLCAHDNIHTCTCVGKQPIHAQVWGKKYTCRGMRKIYMLRCVETIYMHVLVWGNTWRYCLVTQHCMGGAQVQTRHANKETNCRGAMPEHTWCKCNGNRTEGQGCSGSLALSPPTVIHQPWLLCFIPLVCNASVYFLFGAETVQLLNNLTTAVGGWKCVTSLSWQWLIWLFITYIFLIFPLPLLPVYTVSSFLSFLSFYFYFVI